MGVRARGARGLAFDFGAAALALRGGEGDDGGGGADRRGFNAPGDAVEAGFFESGDVVVEEVFLVEVVAAVELAGFF